MLILLALWVITGLGVALVLGPAIRHADEAEDAWLAFCRVHGLVETEGEPIGV